jgi:hypothetical protein
VLVTTEVAVKRVLLVIAFSSSALFGAALAGDASAGGHDPRDRHRERSHADDRRYPDIRSEEPPAWRRWEDFQARPTPPWNRASASYRSYSSWSDSGWRSGSYGDDYDYGHDRYDGWSRHDDRGGWYDRDCRCERRPVVYHPPAPVRVERRPIYIEPRPVYIEQRPVYIEQRPVYIEQPRVYIRSAPIHVASPPIYVQGPPVHVEQPPIYIDPPVVHVTPSPVHVSPPEVHVRPPEVVMEAPPPPPHPSEVPYYGDLPPPDNVAPVAPPPHNYRQEPGERG